jgi:hypothetical protein
METANGNGEWKRRLETAIRNGDWKRRLETAIGSGDWKRRRHALSLHAARLLVSPVKSCLMAA